MEGELAGEIEPGVNTIIGPSTGNFGIGTAYVARLKGYSAVVIMPEQMSAERYQRIRQYGGELDLTPGLRERRHSRPGAHRALQEGPAQQDPRPVRAAAELPLPSLCHRPQRHRGLAQPRQWPGGCVRRRARVGRHIGRRRRNQGAISRRRGCALEPKECSTLFDNGRGTHRIEGIGDKMVTLIHNVLTTDYVALIHDDDCVVGLNLLECRQSILERTLGMPEGSLAPLARVIRRLGNLQHPGRDPAWPASSTSVPKTTS